MHRRFLIACFHTWSVCVCEHFYFLLLLLLLLSGYFLIRWFGSCLVAVAGNEALRSVHREIKLRNNIHRKRPIKSLYKVKKCAGTK